MAWTTFWDMNSGGSRKEPYRLIFIEAREEEAKVIFFNRFKHNPERVSCTCCGPDYSIKEYVDLFQATGFHRHCATKNDIYINSVHSEPLEEFIHREEVLVVSEADIKPEERRGDVPKQGYILVE